MSDILRHVYNACNPNEPATQEQYCDCSKARGDSPLVQKMITQLKLADRPSCFLFAGHIGCGKSSELKELFRQLESNPIPDSKFFPIWVGTGDYLDPYDADTTELLLAIVTEIGETLREKEGIDLRDTDTWKSLVNFWNTCKSAVRWENVELELPFVRLPLQGLRRNPDARMQVRRALEPRRSGLLEQINLVIAAAKQGLVTKRRGSTVKGIVIIVDDLEKVRKITDKPEGFESQSALFLDRAPQLTALDAHVVYTVPLEIARAAGPRLQSEYGKRPMVLPMVKVFDRENQDQPDPSGYQALRRLLECRFRPHAVNDVLGDDTADLLVRTTGGHVRQLLQLIREVCAIASERELVTPIPLEAAEYAVAQTVATYSVMIPEAHWGKIMRLYHAKDQKIINDDSDYLEMLENVSVLEYVNGADRKDLEPWYAVHPIVRRLSRFEGEMACWKGETKGRAKRSSAAKSRKSKPATRSGKGQPAAKRKSNVKKKKR